MIDVDQIQIGSLLKIYNTKGDTYALVLDIDDDQINPPLFHLLIGEQTFWDYLRNLSWEIIK
jgi:hypothetical protein